MSVRVNMKAGWAGAIEQQLKAGLLSLTTDVHTRSTILAPKDTRALVLSGKIGSIANGFTITYGSSRVPYARRRHFENNKNPQTKKYLSKAGDNAMRGDISKHWRGRI